MSVEVATRVVCDRCGTRSTGVEHRIGTHSRPHSDAAGARHEARLGGWVKRVISEFPRRTQDLCPFCKVRP
jgi:hypothetical protein